MICTYCVCWTTCLGYVWLSALVYGQSVTLSIDIHQRCRSHHVVSQPIPRGQSLDCKPNKSGLVLEICDQWIWAVYSRSYTARNRSSHGDLFWSPQESLHATNFESSSPISVPFNKPEVKSTLTHTPVTLIFCPVMKISSYENVLHPPYLKWHATPKLYSHNFRK